MQPMNRGHVLSVHDGAVTCVTDCRISEQRRHQSPVLADDPADVVVIRAAEAAGGVGAVLAKINHGTPPVVGVYPILA